MRLKLLSLLATACFASSLSQAGTATGVLNVNIQLNSPNATGLCVSSSMSKQTQALVKVTCSGGQFVSIEPIDNRVFLGTHGGAYRFIFTGGTVLPSFLQPGDSLYAQIGQGTITALRVLDITERDGRLELLVSF
jgi:hypothetical protein